MKKLSPPCCLLTFFLLFLQSCSNLVKVPMKGSDSAPIITISVVNGIGPSGSAELGSVTIQNTGNPDIVSNVDAGINMVFTSSAYNPGGVKSYSIKINTQARIAAGQPNLFDLTQTGTENASGAAPDRLIIVQVSSSQALIVNAAVGDLVIVTVSAENFNGMQSTGKVVYYPVVNRRTSQSTRFNLAPVAGSSVCEAYFPAEYPGTKYRPNCQILAFENPNEGKNVYMLKPGGDCSLASVLTLIAPLTDLTPLYGSASVKSPLLVQCCNVSFNPSQPPLFPVGSSIPIIVYFTYN